MAAKLGADRASLVLAACAAARTALELLPDDELRPEAALTAIEATVGDAAWETGLLSEHQSALEALAESASDPTVNAVAEAVLAALASTSDPAAAAGAAALAAQASVFDAGDCAMMAALGYAQNQSANAVRHHLAAKWAISAFDSAQGE